MLPSRLSIYDHVHGDVTYQSWFLAPVAPNLDDFKDNEEAILFMHHVPSMFTLNVFSPDLQAQYTIPQTC